MAAEVLRTISEDEFVRERILSIEKADRIKSLENIMRGKKVRTKVK